MRYAIMSDIHANPQALERVLDDAARFIEAVTTTNSTKTGLSLEEKCTKRSMNWTCVARMWW